MEPAVKRARGGDDNDATSSRDVVVILDESGSESDDDVQFVEVKQGSVGELGTKPTTTTRTAGGGGMRALNLVSVNQVASFDPVWNRIELASPVGFDESAVKEPLSATTPIEQEAVLNPAAERQPDSNDLSSGKFVDASFPADSRGLSGSTRPDHLPPPQPPLCRCKLPCGQKVVSKNTRNVGRRFWTCSKRQSGCGFFKWAGRHEWSLSPRERSLVWRRPPIFPLYPSVVASLGFQAGDIMQGQLGDCWFLSALSVLAVRRDLVEQIIITKSSNQSGGPYFIRLFLEGRWKTICVDDQFPCVPPPSSQSSSSSKRSTSKGRVVKRKLAQNEEFALAFSKATRNQLWVPLLEKAYAKAHGSYKAISGGWIAEALFDLTGRPTETISVGSMGEGELFNLLSSFHSEGFPMGASCVAPGKGSGLISSHAYSILSLRTTQLRKARQQSITEIWGGKKKQAASLANAAGASGTRLIQLRNPHGRGEWRGAFSRGSPEWTPALRETFEHTDADNGTFWMPFDLFCANFCHGTVDVCKAPMPRKGWHLYSEEHSFLPGHWCNHKILTVRTGQTATWTHFTVAQATKRGNVDQAFMHCDVAVLVARVSNDQSERLLSVQKINLPGQCKTEHFEMFLEPNARYSIITFSLSRCQKLVETQTAILSRASFTLRLMCGKGLKTQHSRPSSAQNICIGAIHHFMLKSCCYSPQMRGLRNVSVNGLACDDLGNKARVVALESTGAILLFAVNPSPSHFATIEVIVTGLVGEQSQSSSSSASRSGIASNLDRSNAVPAHVLPPLSSRIIAAYSYGGFQDYQVGFNALRQTRLDQTFLITPATVIMHLNDPGNIPGAASSKHLFRHLNLRQTGNLNDPSMNVSRSLSPAALEDQRTRST